jgi:hypothetical protein
MSAARSRVDAAAPVSTMVFIMTETAGRLLQSRGALAECLPARLSMGSVELRLVQPPIQRPGCDFDGAGRLFHVPIGQERKDGLFLFWLQTCDIA